MDMLVFYRSKRYTHLSLLTSSGFDCLYDTLLGCSCEGGMKHVDSTSSSYIMVHEGILLCSAPELSWGLFSFREVPPLLCTQLAKILESSCGTMMTLTWKAHVFSPWGVLGGVRCCEGKRCSIMVSIQKGLSVTWIVYTVVPAAKTLCNKLMSRFVHGNFLGHLTKIRSEQSLISSH